MRPPGTRPGTARIGRISWQPTTDVVTADDSARRLLRLTAGDRPWGADALVRAVAAEDRERLVDLLRETAGGKQPSGPLPLRTTGGARRLVELCGPDTAAAGPEQRVAGVVLDADSVADAAADQLPQGVLCLDRLGLIVYANPRVAELLGEPRARFLGRTLWEGCPGWAGRRSRTICGRRCCPPEPCTSTSDGRRRARPGPAPSGSSRTTVTGWPSPSTPAPSS
ncbi:hypothetical protein GCM10020295_05770 [Streptomyces cinereospinus]